MHLKGVRTYLGAERTKEIFQLQKKKFLSVSLKRINENINVMQRFISKYKPVEPNAIQSLMSGAYSILPEECFTLIGARRATDWGNKHYTKSDRYPSALIHRTMKGEMVRSKSEVVIF